MKSKSEFTFDEWLYVYGSPSPEHVRRFFGLPKDALVERINCLHDQPCGKPHWRASTDRRSKHGTKLAVVVAAS